MWQSFGDCHIECDLCEYVTINRCGCYLHVHLLYEVNTHGTEREVCNFWANVKNNIHMTKNANATELFDISQSCQLYYVDSA